MQAGCAGLSESGIIEHVFETMLTEALDRLDAALAEVTDTNWSGVDAAALSAAFQRLEAHARRRDAVEHHLVAEIDARGIAHEAACRTTAAYLRALCNITPGDAKRRTVAARNLAPGRTFTGTPTPPIYARTAAAESAGVLSGSHAAVITRTIERLPAAVAAEHDLALEADLVRQSAVLDPAQLAVYARHAAYALDQDGVLADEAYRERTRHLTYRQRPDGSVHGEFDLTAPCGEALLSVLDSLAAPRPSTENGRDTRTAAERNHDGLLDLCTRALRDGGLPAAGGTSATILLTITEEQLRERAGLVTTGHGALISLPLALKIATDAEVIPVVFKGAREIAAYGQSQRIATPTQRRVLAARDQGCAFPGCAIPPDWCETHHAPDFQLSRRTRVDELVLLCGYHHREHERLGWTCRMIDGRPHFTPPAWVDASRTPLLNRARR
jgi:hypothetical protein